jgi:hypothetical protein
VSSEGKAPVRPLELPLGEPGDEAPTGTRGEDAPVEGTDLLERVAEVRSPRRDLDKWIRRRLRSYHWKPWGRKRYRELRKRGVGRQLAWNTVKSAHGPWRLSQSPALAIALSQRYFATLGLPSLSKG